MLYVEPLQAPQVIIINRSIKDMRKLVGGNIETANFWVDPVTLVCCVDGKLNCLEPNKAIFKDNKIYDVILGNFILCGADDEEYFMDLSDEMIQKYSDMFHRRELLMLPKNYFIDIYPDAFVTYVGENTESIPFN